MNSSEVSSLPAEASPAPAARSRFAWLDTLRGTALLAMASYHFMWDLADFGYLDAAFPSTGWPKLYARAIATTFLAMAGFSLVLAHGGGMRWKSFWKRFAIIAGAALLVTVGTYFAIPRGFIFFGILHEMALASLIGLLFLRAPWPLTILAAAAAIAAPNYLQSPAFNAPWLWWVGLSTRTHNSFDYVPVLPWIGPFLIGMAIAQSGAASRWLRQNDRGITDSNPGKAALAFLGRHSLVFYLVHQPVLISILYVFSLIVPAPEVAPDVKYIGSCEMTCKSQQDPQFCHQFCGCTLERLQQLQLLVPFQSGAISIDDDPRIKDIAVECTTLSQ